MYSSVSSAKKYFTKRSVLSIQSFSVISKNFSDVLFQLKFFVMAKPR